METLRHAIIPSGLIRSAKTYSLCKKGNNLFMIKVGPAGNQVSGRYMSNPINKFAVNKVYEAIAKKVAAGEQTLQELGPEQVVQEKGNSMVSLHTMTDVTIGKDIYGRTKLTFKAEGKKYRFHFSEASEEEVRTFLSKAE